MRALFSSLVLGVLAAGPVAGAAVIVVPNNNATVGGDAQGPAPFSFYGSTGSHDQIVYPSSQFGGTQNITGIQFRAFPGSSISAFSAGSFSISNVTISLSTTAASEMGADELSPTYANNVGANNEVVYSGPLTLTTSDMNVPGGTTKMFDYSVNLQDAFAYNPSQGNLLLDVNIPVGATVSGAGFGFVTFDEVNDVGDGIASIVSSGAPGTTGTYSTAGPITQFTVASVPEPASIGVVGAGVLGLLARRRRK
jgi:PEP-CTERM motif